MRCARRGWRHSVRRKPLSAPLMVRRGKPLQPTPAGDGLRPAGAREEEHPPTVRQCGNASLAGAREEERSSAGKHIILTLRGNGRPERGVKPRIAGGITSSTASGHPSPRGEGLNAAQLERSLRSSEVRQRFARRNFGTTRLNYVIWSLVSGLYKKRARYGRYIFPYRAPLLTIDY